MNVIPDSHPRASSLRLRHRLVDGLHRQIVTESGLIAHGRGEALDYLLGERTLPFANRAIAAASSMLTLAAFPVMTVNGNVAALAAAELARLAENHPRIGFEVNLFHYTRERAQRIVALFHDLGLRQNHRVWRLGRARGITRNRQHAAVHAPRRCCRADVVLVALEDGDRCKARSRRAAR